MGQAIDRDEVLRLIRMYWTFSDTQQHTHTWHSMADCAEKIRALPALPVVEISDRRKAAAVRFADASLEYSEAARAYARQGATWDMKMRIPTQEQMDESCRLNDILATKRKVRDAAEAVYRAIKAEDEGS